MDMQLWGLADTADFVAGHQNIASSNERRKR
jgi:hypothetical protein